MDKKMIQSAQEFSEEKFTKRVLFKNDESVVFVLNFMPEQQLPAHKHPGYLLNLLVLEGSGELNIDGNPVAITKGDAVQCDGDELFAFKNIGQENASLYVVLSKLQNKNDSSIKD